MYKDREERLAYFRKYNLVRSEREKERTQIYRGEVLKMLGGKCLKCKFSDPRALQVDHINGGGNKEKKIITRRYFLFLKEDILKNKNKYQLLCANCNWIKRYENKEVTRGLKNIPTHN